MRYRSEIDGLRAVAVVPVILFHAGFGLFAGGYVGVDVFFVISGYLITSIIIGEMAEGRFSLARFYERRARRILPALFFVVLCCLPAAWFLLPPSDLREFAQGVFATATFSANILFWQRSGYFDTDAEMNPLLHMWSLAVEEQFYILFPLLLMATWRLGPRVVLATLAALFAVSLGLAQWTVQDSPSAAFYLLHTRAWELLIGAFAAFYLQKNTLATPPWANELLSAAGLAAIVFAIFAFDGATPFPSLYALVPTLGTVLVILFAAPGTLVHRVLSVPGVVTVGLLSYSLYLWHQPLLVFFRFLREPGVPEIAALVALAFLLSLFTFRFVERPARTLPLATPGILAGSAAALTGLAAIGLVGHQSHGFPTRFDPRIVAALHEARAESPVFIEDNRLDDDRCRFSLTGIDAESRARMEDCHAAFGPGVLVFGDSHATNLYHAIVRNADAASHPFVIGISENGCHLPDAPAACHYDDILALLSENDALFSHAIYEKAGYLMLDGSRREIRAEATDASEIPPETAEIEGVLDFLTALSPFTDVVWFGPRIEPLIRAEEHYRDNCRMEIPVDPSQKEIFHELDAYLAARLAATPEVGYISQIEAYDFRFPRDLGSCEALYWMDRNHFSAAGEAAFGRRFDILGALEAG